MPSVGDMTLAIALDIVSLSQVFKFSCVRLLRGGNYIKPPLEVAAEWHNVLAPCDRVGGGGKVRRAGRFVVVAVTTQALVENGPNVTTLDVSHVRWK